VSQARALKNAKSGSTKLSEDRQYILQRTLLFLAPVQVDTQFNSRVVTEVGSKMGELVQNEPDDSLREDFAMLKNSAAGNSKAPDELRYTWFVSLIRVMRAWGGSCDLLRSLMQISLHSYEEEERILVRQKELDVAYNLLAIIEFKDLWA